MRVINLDSAIAAWWPSTVYDSRCSHAPARQTQRNMQRWTCASSRREPAPCPDRCCTLVRTLDLFGPVEVFGDANWLHGGDLAYEVNIISSGPERVVQSHLGTSLNTDQTYRECRGPIDTLLVTGFDRRQEIKFEQDFLNWLREHSLRSRRFGSVCTGAFVLAAAGLLDGRRATTHWKWCNDLARDYPLVTVDR